MTYAGPMSGGRAEMDRERRLRRLQTIATVMDTAITIPGTGIRFGADSILGLVPGIGDLAGAAVGFAIVNEARKLGVPKEKMARMVYNVGLDALAYFKSHRRNVQLILDHFNVDRD